MNKRRLATLAAGAATTGLVVLASPGAASAHVTVTPDTTAAGAYAVLTFSVGHGCEGSPTTRLTIQIPEEINAVTPTINPGWDVKKTQQKLDEPITDAHGNEITERDATVVYTAKTPLPDGYRDAFELSVQLPEAEDETLAFPTIQKCAKGQTPWTEIAAEGEDPDSLESPAPLLTVTAAEGDGHGHGAADDDAAEGTADQAADEAADEAATDDGAADGEGDSASKADESGDGNTLGVLGLAAGVLGLIAGGAALMQVRRRA